MSDEQTVADTTAPGFPDFFDEAPTITLRDPLAAFLGAAHDGLMQYRYGDAVRLAGHSCPTVAGAYLMTLHGLRALYGDDTPVRGDVLVAMADSRDSGGTGVMATVAQLITGAAAETGFGGIAGNFDRRDLLRYDQPVHGIMGLRRADTGVGVQVSLDASIVPFPREMQILMQKSIEGTADASERARFGELWQGRVRQMLIDLVDDPRLIQVSAWN